MSTQAKQHTAEKALKQLGGSSVLPTAVDDRMSEIFRRWRRFLETEEFKELQSEYANSAMKTDEYNKLKVQLFGKLSHSGIFCTGVRRYIVFRHEPK